VVIDLDIHAKTQKLEKDICKMPLCDVTRTCPEHIFKGQRDPRLGPKRCTNSNNYSSACCSSKEQTVENNFLYTDEQLMARLKFFIGICLALTLTGIVFVVLYSLIFVTQPLNAISPIDQKFFELIVPIATFLTGTLSGIMLAGTSKEDKEAMLQAQKTWQVTILKELKSNA
jgi:hypothetical protein